MNNKKEILNVLKKYSNFFNIKDILTHDDLIFLNKYRDKVDIPELSDSIIQLYHIVSFFLKNTNAYTYTYGVNIDHCDFSNDVDVNVNELTSNHSIHGGLVHFDYIFKGTLRSHEDSFVNSFEKALTDLFLFKEEEGFPVADITKPQSDHFSNASPKFISLYAQLLVYVESFDIYTTHFENELYVDSQFVNIPVFPRLKFNILKEFKTEEGIQNRFSFENGQWFTELDIHYVKKYCLQINFKTYIEEYGISRESKIIYSNEDKAFRSFYVDSRGYERPEREKIDELLLHNVNDINNFINISNKHKLISVTVEIQTKNKPYKG